MPTPVSPWSAGVGKRRPYGPKANYSWYWPEVKNGRKRKEDDGVRVLCRRSVGRNHGLESPCHSLPPKRRDEEAVGVVLRGQERARRMCRIGGEGGLRIKETGDHVLVFVAAERARGVD